MPVTSGDPIADKRHARGEDYREAGDHTAAEDMFSQALELVPDWPVGLMSLARARLARGDLDGARVPLERVLALDPADSYGAGGLLARATGRDDGQVLSQAYVAGLFDSYADRFDAHLTGALLYDAPLQLRFAIDQARSGRLGRALDLGCGTGLLGSILRDLVDDLVGIDLSAGMIALAEKKGIYDALIQGDLVDTLSAEPAESADLVTAADVLVYLGDLQPLFLTTARVLKPGGLFVFTVQDAGERERVLGPEMRYSHGASYLRALAKQHGLAAMRIDQTSTRIDGGQPVPGLLVVMVREALAE